MNSDPNPSNGTTTWWQASADQLRSLLETAGTVVIGLRPDRTIFEWNDAALRTFGYTREEMIGHNFFADILPASHHGIMANEIEKALAGEVIRGLQTPGIECNGEISILLWNMTRVADSTGEVAGVLAIGQDVTERERAARAIDEARQAAESANRARGDFLANMSHEIRTPLNGILGMTELVLDSPLSPEQRARLSAAHRSAEDLLALVNDVLDFSRIDAGRLELHREDFNLRDALGASWRLFGSRAARKGLEFAVRIDAEVPETVSGDPLRLRQVINNLIDNAIKFTEQGGVTVEIDLESRGASASDRVALHCKVTDTGPGIAPSKQARIFEAFRQADASITRRYGGTGLGLSICVRLANLMGGRLWVESVPGSGSQFHFVALFDSPAAVPEPPIALEAGSAAVVAPAPNGGTLRGPARDTASPRLQVWVAEDNAINSEVIVALLDGMGHQITSFTDGRQLVEKLKATPIVPDVVLMDLQMPVLDGIEATREIRRLEESAALRSRGRLPIVALTAHARWEDRVAAGAAGFDDYLTKPVRRMELAGVLGRVQPAGCRSGDCAGRDEGGTTQGQTHPPKGAELWDREALRADLSGNEALLLRLMRTYLDHTPAIRAALTAAWESGDAVGVGRAAHTLGGSLAQLRAGPALKLVRQLDQEQPPNSSWPNETMAALNVELDRLATALQAELEPIQ